MSRTSFGYRVLAADAHHVHVSVFAGPDEQHRACAGQLTFKPDEWADFCDRVAGPGHSIVFAESLRDDMSPVAGIGIAAAVESVDRLTRGRDD